MPVENPSLPTNPTGTMSSVDQVNAYLRTTDFHEGLYESNVGKPIYPATSEATQATPTETPNTTRR